MKLPVSVVESFDDIQRNFEKLSETMDAGPWQAPSMLNSWTNYMSSLRFTKDPNGFVHIEGEIAPGTLTAGTPIFQLPPGYRPPYRRYWIVASNGANGAFEVTSGGVFQVSDNQAATASVVYNLGGLVFGAN